MPAGPPTMGLCWTVTDARTSFTAERHRAFHSQLSIPFIGFLDKRRNFLAESEEEANLPADSDLDVCAREIVSAFLSQ